MIKSAFCFLFISFYLSLNLDSANLELETKKASDIFKKIKLLGKAYGNKNVLVVFDIDNTLLAAEAQLGSDQWYSLEEKLFLEKKPGGIPNLKDINDLFFELGLIYAFEDMRLTDPKLPEQIKEIQKLGYPVISLTSRGPYYLFMSIRDLIKNGISFRNSALKPKNGFPGTWPPLDKEQQFSCTLNKKEKKLIHKNPERLVAYRHGVFFTAGLHKGVMLKLLLCKTKKQPKAIVFIDDKAKHTKRVQEVFKDSKIEIITFRYGIEDQAVVKFQNTNKNITMNEWKKFREAVNNANVGALKKLKLTPNR